MKDIMFCLRREGDFINSLKWSELFWEERIIHVENNPAAIEA